MFFDLTEQVVYIPLEKGSKVWAQLVLEFANQNRSGINEEKSGKLLQFDSANVAKKLQEFYLQVSRGAQDQCK